MSDPNTDLPAVLRAALRDPGTERSGQLADRLAADAWAAGLVDVAVRRLASPVGDLLVAATPVGVVRVAFEVEDHDAVVDRLAALVGPRVLAAGDGVAVLDDAAGQLGEYFEGRRRDFDLPLDLRAARGFRRVVLDHLRLVPYGATASYSELAAAAGNRRAVRAAASACATNPVPVVVPCHRVVRSDGSIGRYLGGTAAKAALLRLEAG